MPARASTWYGGPYAAGAYPRHADDPRAACRGTDPEAWFDRSAGAHAELAVICDRCPVYAQCRRWSLQPIQATWLDGFWAGLNQPQRAAFHRCRAEVAGRGWCRHGRGCRWRQDLVAAGLLSDAQRVR